MKSAIEMYLAHEDDIRRIVEARLAKLAQGRPEITFDLAHYEPFDEGIILSIVDESGDFAAAKKGTTLQVRLRDDWDVEAERTKHAAEQRAKEAKEAKK